VTEKISLLIAYQFARARLEKIEHARRLNLIAYTTKCAKAERLGVRQTKQAIKEACAFFDRKTGGKNGAKHF
jgi:hypothetical protein